MAELGRRLRQADRPGVGKAGEAGVQAPAERVLAAKSDSLRAVPAGREADPEATSAAIAAAADDSEPPPLPADAGGEEQSGEGTLDELPPVEELAQRVPQEARAVLDELFHAQWTEVRRLRPGDLRS